MRVAMGGPYALDFGAIMTMGAALEVDVEMLAEVLPALEGVVLAAFADGEDET